MLACPACLNTHAHTHKGRGIEHAVAMCQVLQWNATLLYVLIQPAVCRSNTEWLKNETGKTCRLLDSLTTFFLSFSSYLIYFLCFPYLHFLMFFLFFFAHFSLSLSPLPRLSLLPSSIHFPSALLLPVSLCLSAHNPSLFSLLIPRVYLGKTKIYQKSGGIATDRTAVCMHVCVD